MTTISRKIHGVLDYAVGSILVAAPWLFGLDASSAEGQVPIALGLATLIYSFMTRYELGVVKVIPFQTHLTLDMMGGILLALSPWLFAFAERRWGLHLTLGLLEIGAVLMTQRESAPPAGGAHG